MHKNPKPRKRFGKAPWIRAEEADVFRAPGKTRFGLSGDVARVQWRSHEDNPVKNQKAMYHLLRTLNSLFPGYFVRATGARGGEQGELHSRYIKTHPSYQTMVRDTYRNGHLPSAKGYETYRKRERSMEPDQLNRFNYYEFLQAGITPHDHPVNIGTRPINEEQWQREHPGERPLTKTEKKMGVGLPVYFEFSDVHWEKLRKYVREKVEKPTSLLMHVAMAESLEIKRRIPITEFLEEQEKILEKNEFKRLEKRMIKWVDMHELR